MVPIDPARLRAAVEYGDLTVANIVAALNRRRSDDEQENRQTFHAMMRGDRPKRCRFSRRRRLAHVLDVPENWLSGGNVELPLGAYVLVNELAQKSPRVGLAVLKLATRCAQRCAKEMGVDVSTAAEGQFEKDPRFHIVNGLTWAIGALADPNQWRRELLRFPNRPTSPAEIDELLRTARTPPWQRVVEPWSTSQEEAALGIVRALAYILNPWLAEEARLNYARMHQLIAIVQPMFHEPPPDVEAPKVAFVGRQDEHVVQDPLSPFALLRWRNPATAETDTRMGESASA
jgi:hypothetical protein